MFPQNCVHEQLLLYQSFHTTWDLSCPTQPNLYIHLKIAIFPSAFCGSRRKMFDPFHLWLCIELHLVPSTLWYFHTYSCIHKHKEDGCLFNREILSAQVKNMQENSHAPCCRVKFDFFKLQISCGVNRDR